jgi:hypothetical protein
MLRQAIQTGFETGNLDLTPNFGSKNGMFKEATENCIMRGFIIYILHIINVIKKNSVAFVP